MHPGSITEITFGSEFDSVRRPASVKKRIMASSSEARKKAIYSHIVFSSVANEAECVGRTLEVGGPSTRAYCRFRKSFGYFHYSNIFQRVNLKKFKSEGLKWHQ